MKYVISLTRPAVEYAEAVVEAASAEAAEEIFWNFVDVSALDWREGDWAGRPDIAETFKAEDFPGGRDLPLSPYDLPATYEELAQAARPQDDFDWGSERQITAETAFYETVGPLGEAFEQYALKATADEAIDEALRIIRRRQVR
jgi:hypothetical protein